MFYFYIYFSIIGRDSFTNGRQDLIIGRDNFTNGRDNFTNSRETLQILPSLKMAKNTIFEIICILKLYL